MRAFACKWNVCLPAFYLLVATGVQTELEGTLVPWWTELRLLLKLVTSSPKHGLRVRRDYS